MTYTEYVKTYETMLSIYLNDYKPPNTPSEARQMIESANNLASFEEAYPAYATKYEPQF